MKKIIDIIAYVFIGLVTVLTVVSVLGVWDLLVADTVRKSVQSISVLAFATLIIMLSVKYVDNKDYFKNKLGILDFDKDKSLETFKNIRQVTIMALITIVVLMAFVGVLSIWDLFESDAVGRSFGTMAIAAFSSFIIVVTCLYRERIGKGN